MVDDLVYKFDYDFDRERLLKEAMEQGEWRRGDTETRGVLFEDGIRRRKLKMRNGINHSSSRAVTKIDYFNKNAHPDTCPYAMEIRNHFHNLTKLNCAFQPQFWLLKEGSPLPFHLDPFQCVINLVLTEDPDPIKFKSSEDSDYINEVYYNVGLVNTQILHSIEGGKTRYLFKLPFSPRVPFSKVKEVLSSKLSEI
jgi:hypothetical protein